MRRPEEDGYWPSDDSAKAMRMRARKVAVLWLQEGLTRRRIADALGAAASTVTSYLKHMEGLYGMPAADIPIADDPDIVAWDGFWADFANSNGRRDPYWVHWICDECGMAASGGCRFATDSTWHTGICDACGEERAVTEARDYFIGAGRKQCSKCGAWEKPSEYPVRKKTGKLEAQCKECYNNKSKEWYRNNTERGKNNAKLAYQSNRQRYIDNAIRWNREHPERRSEIARNWRWKEREMIIEAYGGVCVCCGETIPEFLTIDYANNDGAAKRKQLPKSKQGGAGFYRYLRELGYPKDEYQLLCFNCNFAKQHFGVCPHIIQSMEEKE